MRGTTGEKLWEKLSRLNINQQELATLLNKLGFKQEHGKGSHMVWKHPGYPGAIVLATHDKELKPYQIKQVKQFLGEAGIML